MFGYSFTPTPRRVGSSSSDVVQPVAINELTPVRFYDTVIDTGEYFDGDGTTIHLAVNTGYLLMCATGLTGSLESTLITSAWLAIASPDLSVTWTNDASIIEPAFRWTGRISLYIAPQPIPIDVTFFAHIEANEIPTNGLGGAISIIEI